MPPHNFTLSSRDAALAAWWQGSLARELLAQEGAAVGEALEDVFGWELLQIGAWGRPGELLAASRTRHRAILAPTKLAGAPDILGRPAQLPTPTDSVDAVLLPHTLEFASDPYAIVREADRVLTAEGQFLVLGLKPWSLWGWRVRFSGCGFPPGLRRVLSERRVRDWLVLLGYEALATPPLPGGAWLLKARKRVYTLTPIRSRFRERPAPIGGLVKPTTRSSS